MRRDGMTTYEKIKGIANKCKMYFRFGPGERACNNCLFVKRCKVWKREIIGSNNSSNGLEGNESE
jgi:hypothetical protein